jgi:dTDP-4-dehydrorhamnose reductase
MKSVLLIGQNGQVTTYLQRILGDDFRLIVAGRDQLDLSKLDSIRSILESIKPDMIVNPAAYTAVDMAEQESELAYCINRDAVAEIAAYSAATNTPLIHFSTDYVFAGDANAPYIESDDPAPTGVYGASKLAGERAITRSGAPAIVLRTSWVYSNHGKNFYQTMLNLAQNRSELSVVADQFGAPTYAGSIADATRLLLLAIDRQGDLKPSQKGVFHFSCGGQTTWCDFAKSLFVVNGLDHMVVNKIATSEYPTPAKRPAFSVLDCSKLKSEFGVELPQWQDALEHCAAETNASL